MPFKIQGLFNPATIYGTDNQKTFVPKEAAYNTSVQGNTSHPVAKSDFPSEAFTPGYYIKAQNLDYIC